MDKRNNIFNAMNRHLLEDKIPSDFFKDLDKTGKLSVYPFKMLERLKNTEQSPKHHPEGNVWNHTMLVIDTAASIKDRSSDVRAFMWSALLHDIGKPDATKKRRDKITAYDHDKIGAILAKEFLEQFHEEQTFINKVTALVRFHMQILFVVKSLPFADINNMKKQTTIYDVALLGLCDRLGRFVINEEKRLEEEQNIRMFLIKCGADEKDIRKILF